MEAQTGKGAGRKNKKERKLQAAGLPSVDFKLWVLAGPPEIAPKGRVGSCVFER